MAITRRSAVFGVALLPVTPALAGILPAAPIVAIEKRTGGRLGVTVLDSKSGRRIEHRAHERFALCSTFKFLLAAAVLARIDAGREHPDRFIGYGPNDLVVYSPVTEAHLGEGGMTLSALLESVIERSDNTAANLLLRTLGGPKGWSLFARSLGDPTSRLDRIETELNSAIPGDPRDTTTPFAMLTNMKKILLGRALSDTSRQKLEDWLMASATGAHRLRAGLPPDWRVGDKTGSGEHGARNDIAILRPPGRAPILACVYFAESSLSDDARDAAIADVGRVIASAF
jgi:beta-lactamase class A